MNRMYFTARSAAAAADDFRNAAEYDADVIGVIAVARDGHGAK